MTEYTAQQIVDFLKSGEGPDSLYASGQIAEQMAAKHVEARDMMTRLQAAMSEAWSGNAAGQAQAGAGPLLAASEVSAVHLAAAQSALTTQGVDYTDLKNKVGDGPGPQPQEDFLSRHLPMLTDKDEEIAAWNARAQEVVQHYGTYNGQSTDNTAGLPTDYGDLTLPAGGTDVQHAEKPSTVTPPADHRTSTDRTTTHVDQHRATVPGQDVSWQQQRPGEHTETHTSTSTTTNTSTNVPTGTTTPPGQDDTTRTSGLAPVASNNPADGRTSPNLPGTSFGRDGGSGDINARLGPGVPGTPETLGVPGSGRIGTPGSSGSSSGGTSGRGGSVVEGPGGRSGAGRLGAGGMARAGVAGASGKPGVGGGMAGPMGRGQKEEDKEHKRLEVLQEPDPDELFGGFPDGMKPVPPTIGA